MAVDEIVECVPNVSEGRRREVLDALSETVTAVAGVKLLDVDADESHNRAVFTFVGSGAAVSEAAFRLAKRAAEFIDLNQHKGEHPRMGATDVIPFVPVMGVTMEACVQLARKLGERIGVELRIPVFLYGEAATRPERRNLPDVRKGEFEGLREAIGKDPAKDPDYGPRRIHPNAGATAVGARPFLIAYNVNLEIKDLQVAKDIASKVREKDGGLPAVRALGFALENRGLVQVSMNLVDYRKTSPAQAFEAVAREAVARGVSVHSSEVVGLIPLDALPDNAVETLKLEGFSGDQILEVKLLGAGDPALGDKVGQILGAGSTAAKPLGEFLNALASGDPTPGGGAAAAVLGAVGASLAMMSCRLTEGKTEFEARRGRFREVEAAAHELQRKFVAAIDEDIRAYNAVLDALRLPKATPDDQAVRSASLQKAFHWATEVPLTVAEDSAAAIELLEELGRIGLKSAISDVGVGGKAARAAFDGARYNVLINLGSIKDAAFSEKARSRLAGAQAKADRAGAALDALVAAELK